MDYLQTGKEVHKSWILLPCLFNLYAEYIKQSARLDKAQAGLRLQGEKSITLDKQMTAP